jgi:hypothetical protein
MAKAKSYILFRSGYKYQLASDYTLKIDIKPDIDIVTKFIKLDTQGRLTVFNGYAWDGPSGPVIDTRENMRASLVHDALYQLMRLRLLSAKRDKNRADKLFKTLCIRDGVSHPVAEAYYLGLKIGGEPATDPKNQKKVYRAP